MNQKGFSLIELMVVVAIIGILSAVAVPQFQKFQRKAKQSEAKANLSALFTGQKVFSAEHNTFYRNIIATGYAPEGAMNYNITAYASGGGAPQVSAAFNASSTNNHYAYHFETYYTCTLTYAGFHSTWDPGGPIGTNCKLSSFEGRPPGLFVTTSTFKVGAAGDIGGSVDDHWTIDNRKELINTQNGAL